jgi:hypothetical protein
VLQQQRQRRGDEQHHGHGQRRAFAPRMGAPCRAHEQQQEGQPQRVARQVQQRGGKQPGGRAREGVQHRRAGPGGAGQQGGDEDQGARAAFAPEAARSQQVAGKGQMHQRGQCVAVEGQLACAVGHRVARSCPSAVPGRFAAAACPRFSARPCP